MLTWNLTATLMLLWRVCAKSIQLNSGGGYVAGCMEYSGLFSEHWTLMVMWILMLWEAIFENMGIRMEPSLYLLFLYFFLRVPATYFIVWWPSGLMTDWPCLFPSGTEEGRIAWPVGCMFIPLLQKKTFSNYMDSAIGCSSWSGPSCSDYRCLYYVF